MKMKMFAIQSIVGTWTNEDARKAMKVSVYSSVVVTNPKNRKTVTLELHKAPVSAVNVLKAVKNLTGGFGLAMDESVLRELGIKPGQIVEVQLAKATSRAGSLKSRMEAE